MCKENVFYNEWKVDFVKDIEYVIYFYFFYYWECFWRIVNELEIVRG